MENKFRGFFLVFSPNMLWQYDILTIREGSNVTASDQSKRTRVILALLAVYLSWGSTYLVIRIALVELPPLFLMGIRFFLFGIGIYGYLRMRGAPNPVFGLESTSVSVS